ncbi:uncharacterized protein MONBRDRAFT_33599 [Monosiga brevicollis MX1]|uniref:Major facilitator superfamily (MFS) profile domain-containing protein n=1 Tax=Monosiga brevicollis TaxID=81824 RepID=A9V6C0_MONBE|nr:uncharacterized protein MONBRDRAFT_33599 [Monosiga brevicollis MX1]EDQ87041.1 predicted protein [Monosiga brevicollis MX1]|eukprot:XP_001748280.1 hypothetical protein [Monosiga brevicollis MX1]
MAQCGLRLGAGLSMTLVWLALLVPHPAHAYIDDGIFRPDLHDTFQGRFTGLTGTRFFGFQEGGQLHLWLNCSASPGHVYLAGLTQKQYGDLRERPSVTCADIDRMAYAVYLPNSTHPTLPNTYEVADHFGGPGRHSYYNFMLLECPPGLGSDATPVTCEYLLETINPGGEQLSRDEIPLPEVYRVFAFLWAAIIVLAIVNTAIYFRFSNAMHKLIFLPVIIFLVVFVLEYHIWTYRSSHGTDPVAMVNAKTILQFLAEAIFFLVVLCLSTGWYIIHESIERQSRNYIWTLPLSSFGLALLRHFVHPYFLILIVLVTVIMVVFVIRASGANLIYLQHRRIDLIGMMNQDLAVHPRLLLPLNLKLRMLSRVRALFVAYCILWVIISISASFLSEHTWIAEIMVSALGFLFYACLLFIMRLWDFSPFFATENLASKEVNVELFVDKQQNPLGVLVQVDDGRWQPAHAAALVMFTTYTGCYFLRKTLTAAALDLLQEQRATEADLGLLTSFFSLGYGLSKIPGGIVADLMAPGQMLQAVLLISAALNITFALVGMLSTWMGILLWTANGFVLGFGWSPIGALIHAWFPDPEGRATWWALISTSQNVGAGLAPIAIMNTMHLSVLDGGLLAPWQRAFVWPALLMAALVPFVGTLLTVPSKEKRVETSSKTAPQRDWATWFRELRHLPSLLVLLVVANMLIYLTKDILSNWSLLMLVHDKGMERSAAGLTLSYFEAGGIVGSMVAGLASDQLFEGRRGPVCCLYGLGFAAVVLWVQTTTATWALQAGYALAGAFLFGPQTLMGLFAMEISPRAQAALAGSLVSVFSQFGAGLAGYPITVLQQVFGREVALSICVVGGLAWAGVMLPTWGVRPRATRHD